MIEYYLLMFMIDSGIKDLIKLVTYLFSIFYFL